MWLTERAFEALGRATGDPGRAPGTLWGRREHRGGTLRRATGTLRRDGNDKTAYVRGLFRVEDIDQCEPCELQERKTRHLVLTARDMLNSETQSWKREGYMYEQAQQDFRVFFHTINTRRLYP